MAFLAEPLALRRGEHRAGDAIEFDAVAMRRLMEDNDVLGRELTARFMRSVLDRLRAARVHLHDLYQDRPVQPSE